MDRQTTLGEPEGEIAVLHVLDSLEAGGAQNVVIQMLEWLAVKGVRVGVIASGGEFESRLPPRLDRYITRGRRPHGREIASAAAAFRPTLLHAHQRREALLSLVVGGSRGIPVVEHAHTLLPDSGIRALSFRSERIYAVSGAVADMVIERFSRPADRVRRVDNVPSVPPLGKGCASLPREGAPLRIIGAGRLVPQKNPARFVSVVAHLARSTSVQARWFGDGPLLEASRRYAERLGAPVRFVGRSAGLADELDASHALVMTSRWEGTPLVALEAHARATPVFSTRASAVAEPDDLTLGYSIDDEDDDSALADLILTAFASPGDLLSDVERMRERIVREHSPAVAFAPILADYERIARGGRPLR